MGIWGKINWLRSWGKGSPAPAPASNWIKPGIVQIPLTGSLQNPAWSPEGCEIVFTRFLNGYNEGPAELWVWNFITGTARCILKNGHDNVCQPGSTWHPKSGIIFSSDFGGNDAVYSLVPAGPILSPVKAPFHSYYEPSWAPNGKDFVFEAHSGGANGQVVIWRSGTCQTITSPLGDCRQPNWSPTGKHIVYQEKFGGRWELFLYDVASGQGRRITTGMDDDKTDATFSPDGQRILFSGTRANGSDGLMTISLRGDDGVSVNHGPGYFGAASLSSAGWIAAETSPFDPEGRTSIAIVDAHK